MGSDLDLAILSFQVPRSGLLCASSEVLAKAARQISRCLHRLRSLRSYREKLNFCVRGTYLKRDTLVDGLRDSTPGGEVCLNCFAKSGGSDGNAGAAIEGSATLKMKGRTAAKRRIVPRWSRRESRKSANLAVTFATGGARTCAGAAITTPAFMSCRCGRRTRRWRRKW